MEFKNTEVWGFKHALRGMRNPMNSWDKSDSYFNIISSNINATSIKNSVKDIKLNDGIIGAFQGQKYYGRQIGSCEEIVCIGKNDMDLARRLIRAGSEHRKFLRQIFVSVDITAPLYWWKEFDTYKVGTTANSTSTMHKILSKPLLKQSQSGRFFDLNDEVFELGDYCSDLDLIDDVPLNVRVWGFIDTLEQLRNRCLTIQDSLKDDELAPEVREVLMDDFNTYWKELIRWLPENYLQTRTVTLNYENIYTIIHQRKNHKLSEWSGESGNSFLSWAKSLPYIKELFELEN